MHAGQLRRAVQSVGANISEGFGRRAGPGCDHVRRNAFADYRPPGDLLAVTLKMLTLLPRRRPP